MTIEYYLSTSGLRGAHDATIGELLGSLLQPQGPTPHGVSAPPRAHSQQQALQPTSAHSPPFELRTTDTSAPTVSFGIDEHLSHGVPQMPSGDHQQSTSVPTEHSLGEDVGLG